MTSKNILSRRDPATFRQARPGYSLMVPHLLRSGIFALSAKTASAVRALPKFDDIDDSWKGASVEYKGAPLLQSDLSVLLGLLQLAGGMHFENMEVGADAQEFLKSINRDSSTDGVNRLHNSLASLRSATFVVRNFSGHGGFAFGFIDEVKWDKRRFTVKLSAMAHRALDHFRITYLPMTVRNKLKDGVQTALADVMYSTTADSFDNKALAALMGRKPDQVNQFAKEIRENMPRLVEVGVLTSWSKTRGRLHVVRAAHPA